MCQGLWLGIIKPQEYVVLISTVCFYRINIFCLSLELIDHKWCIFIPKNFIGFHFLNILQ